LLQARETEPVPFLGLGQDLLGWLLATGSARANPPAPQERHRLETLQLVLPRLADTAGHPGREALTGKPRDDLDGDSCVPGRFPVELAHGASELRSLVLGLEEGST